MPINNIMHKVAANERIWHREVVSIAAQYFIKDQNSKYTECTIIDLSRGGAGVLFPGSEKLEHEDSVFLDITVPHTFVELTVVGTVKRIFKDGHGIVGGIQFESPLPEQMFNKLMGEAARGAPSRPVAQISF